MLWSNWLSPIPHHSPPPTSENIHMWISPSHTHRFIVSFPFKLPSHIHPLCPTPAWPPIFTTSSYLIPPPQVPFFFNHVPLSLTSQLTTHARYISLPYMVFECRHNIRNQPVSTTIPFPSPFCNSATTETHRHFGKILIDIFLIFF